MAEKKFRTAMNGYNKEDVHHYIEELAVEAEQKLLQKEEYVKKMEHELARIRNENMKYKTDSEQMRRKFLMEIDGLKEELEKERQECARLQHETAEQQTQPVEAPAPQVMNQLNAENQRLLARVQKLEEERDKIPAALIVAQRQADEIVANSKEKMQQYEAEMQEKVSSAYKAGMEKMKQMKERIDGSASMLGDMENQVRMMTSKFVQSIGQSKRETAELAKVFEAEPLEEIKPQQSTEGKEKEA